jgi:hypothetical protein
MAGTRRVSTAAALIVCLVGSPLSGSLFASQEKSLSSDAPSPQSDTAAETQGLTPPAVAVTADSPATARDLFSDERLLADAPVGVAGAQAWRSTFNFMPAESSSFFMPAESSSFAQRGGYRGRGGRNGAAVAIILGAAAAIAGTAVLVYANRPECSTNQMAGGCGYGTKVVGGAVLSAGIVGIMIGALTWR